MLQAKIDPGALITFHKTADRSEIWHCSGPEPRKSQTSAFHPFWSKAARLVSASIPLRTFGSQAIHASVSVRAGLDALSKRAPVIVIIALCAALVSAWSGAPDWLPNGAAIVVGSLALVLLAARSRRNQFRTTEDQSRDWIAYELAGKGSPQGFYPLAFFGIVTIVLTGIEAPSAKLAWAGFCLGVVWGIVNAHYPADEA